MTKLSSAEAAALLIKHGREPAEYNVTNPNPAVTILQWTWWLPDALHLKLYLTDVGAGHDHAQWRLE